MKSSQPGSRPADRVVKRAVDGPPPYRSSQFVPMPSPSGFIIHRKRCYVRENSCRGSPLISAEWPSAVQMSFRRDRVAAGLPRRSLLIIDGSHAVGQTRLPEVKATESSGDLGLPLRMPRTAAATTISPCCSDSSPIEKSWPLWPETVSAENADEAISTRLRAG